MAKLKESEVEKILKKAGGVFGDKGIHRDWLHHHPHPHAGWPSTIAMAARVER